MVIQFIWHCNTELLLLKKGKFDYLKTTTLGTLETHFMLTKGPFYVKN